MQCRLEPASAGTITSDMTTGIYDGTWVGNYRVQLDAPATIVVEPSTTTTVKSKSGATVEVPVSEDDPSYYNGTLLVADELDGTEAQGAKAKLTAKVADVTNSVAYDLHFEKYVWNGTSMVTETMLPKDGDTIKVTLPIPEELSTDGLHVYYVAEDGTVTDMNGTVDADARTITFETTHFSTYVLANVKGSEPTKPTEPTNPTKPTEPTNPTDPTTPTDSVETTTKTTVSTASVKEKPKSPSAGASATPETGDNAIGSSAVAAVAAAAFATLGIVAVLRRRSQS